MPTIEQHWLLLPGYACTGEVWGPVTPLLSEHAHINAITWPRDRTPGFKSIVDFANWLDDHLALSDFTAVVGHSMGGMTALTLAARGRIHAPIVLVESFITPPAPFFHNLLMPGCRPEIEAFVKNMLAEEGKFFNPSLRAELRGSDLSACITGTISPILALYGDRGSGRAAALKDLHWPKAVQQRVAVTTVPDACHFPMLENPHDTASAIIAAAG